MSCIFTFEPDTSPYPALHGLICNTQTLNDTFSHEVKENKDEDKLFIKFSENYSILEDFEVINSVRPKHLAYFNANMETKHMLIPIPSSPQKIVKDNHSMFFTP